MKNLTKRSLAILLALCMLAGLVPASVITAFAQGNKASFYGDADADGDVDLQDVLIIEKYISDSTVTLDKKRADVNADAAVDATDAEIIRDYLVGNRDTLTPVLVTISFNTNGGDEIPSIEVGKGYTYKGEIPNAVKADASFVNWKTEDGSIFYQDSMVIEDDTTLNAVYEAMPSKQELTITSFSVENQKPSYSVKIVSKSEAYNTAEAVKSAISLLPKDGSEPVAVDVTDNGNGNFTVYAPDGFLTGASYELTLPEGLSFEDKDDMFRTNYFTIKKDSVDDIEFSSDLIFIKDTADMKYTIDGVTTDILEAAFLTANDEETTQKKGTFTMPDSTLKADDIVCIYENLPPDERDYTKHDYEDDALAYVRITSVDGITHSFESINEEDADEVLSMPDTILYNVEKLPTSNGTVLKDDYDAYARIKLGQEGSPDFKIDDFIVFYMGDFDSIDKNTTDANVVYAQITKVEANEVSYKIIDKEDVENYMGMFVTKEIEGDKLLSDKDQEKLLKDVEKQAIDSGFAEKAAEKMAGSALETKEVQEQLKEQGLSDSEISNLRKRGITSENSAVGAGGKAMLTLDGLPSVVPSIITSDRFKNGIGIGLTVTIVLSIDVKVNTKMSSLKIALSAGFEEEVAFGFDVSVEDRWKWYAFIPVLEDLDVNVSVDIQNYTYISLGAKIYTISEDITKKKWQAYKHEYFDVAPMEVKNAINELNKLGPKIKKLRKNVDKVTELLDQVEEYKAMLPKVKIGDQEYSFEQLEESLGTVDASESFDEMFNAEDQSEYKTGLNSLMKKYQDMLKQECDWVQLFDKEICAKEFHLKVVAIKLSLNLVARGNVNIAIGADVEYQVGKRYMFWLHILDKTSGSSEMDLNDERFGFQFYVMGTLGLKIGVKAEISFGIISTSFASIGGNIEFGPYIRLWGYFFYTFERLRPAGSKLWNENEELMGALYLEFGLYLAVRFKAQIFDNTFKYEPTLYEGEFPLLTAGEKLNVYDFVLQPTSNDKLYIKDSDANSLNGATMALPEIYYLMKRINLCTGEMTQGSYPKEKFNVTFSDSDFYLNNNNVICVKNQGNGRFYKTTDMRIVWKCDKLAFSKFDTDITVPLVYTNYSEEEINERFTATVKVGNPTDGYSTEVWSKQVGRLDVFDLPTEEEVLDLIGYYDYETANGNIKYSNIGGYTEASTDLTLAGDKTYYFNIDKKQYELTVNGIHNADGSTKSKTFTASYGESFDLSSLKNTGKNNSATNEYTSFKNVTDINGEPIDEIITANLSFISKFGGTKGSINADYNNDTLTATYKFTGIGNVEDVIVKFKRGTTPSFDGLDDYVNQHGGENAYVESTDPKPLPSNHSVTYNVKCVVKEVKKYNLTYKNGSTTYKTYPFVEGADADMYRTTEPEKTGYTFGGWYSDSALTNSFDFNTKLPANNVTLYAKWTANSYTLSFVTGDYASTPSAIKVVYDEAYGKYGEWPNPKSTNHRFIGWYTDKNGNGTQITESSTFNVDSDQTLYAYWKDKVTVDKSWLPDPEYDKISTVFNENYQSYTYTLPSEHEALRTGMVVEYIDQSTNKKLDTLPIKAGTYDIKFSRPSCDYYKALDEHYITGGLTIAKADMGTLAAPDVFTNGYGTIAASNPSNIKGDGKVTYTLYRHFLSTSFKYDENDNGLFSGLGGGKYSISISVAEGTNYKATSSDMSSAVNVGSCKNLGYTVQFYFYTSDGTDSDIHGYIEKNYTNLGDVFFNHSGNDFEAGDSYTYTVAENISPWTITKAGIKKGKNIGFRPAWSFSSQIKVVKGDKSFSCDLLSKSEWGANVEDSVSTRFFKRQITSYGNFKPDNYRYISLSDTSDWTYTYSGNISDQFGYYNIFEYEDAPKFYIKSLYPEHQQFVKRTGLTSYTIDRKGLNNYVKTYGGNEPQYYIYLSLGTTVGNGIASHNFHREIIYFNNIPKQNKSINGVGGSYSASEVSSNAKSVTPVGSSSDEALTENNAFVLSANDINANIGDTISVPVKVDTNKGIWGTLASIKYNNKVLELQDYAIGYAYKFGNYAATKDLSRDTFKLLISSPTTKNSTIADDLITLKFKVTDKADEPYYPITLDIEQTINAKGNEVQSKSNNIRLNLDQTAPVISGVENGGIYYGDTTVTVTDSFFDKLTVDGNEVALTDGAYTITADNNEHTIVATDRSGNSVEYKITVNKVYTASFMDANNEVCATLNVNHNSALGNLPDVPAKEGYDQVAPYWTIDGEAITEDTVITSDVTVIPVYTINKYGISVPTEQIGYELSVDKNETDWNGSAKLTFKLADGYSMTDSFAVKVNGTAVELADGEYTISDIKENVAVTVEGVADVTAPTVEITLGTNSWNKLINAITFGLFFNETQTVTVTADDANIGSGINKVYYYLASEQMTEDDLKAVTQWQEYTDQFSIDPNNQYVIYVKAIDNAGNTTYINSDGIVLDSIAPAISGVENGGTYYGDTTVTVTDSFFDKLTVDGNEVALTDGAYTITADNNEHTIVVTDRSGNSVEYKITVNKVYTASFMDANNEVCATLNVNHNSALGNLPDVPAKEGYDQVAPYWTIDGEAITEETVITGDVTVIPVYTINKYGISVPTEQIGYELSVDKNETDWNGSAKLTFKLADGYLMTDSFAVKVNGTAVELTDGEYTISDIKENVVVTVEGVASIVADTDSNDDNSNSDSTDNKAPLTSDSNAVQTGNPTVVFGLLLVLVIATVSVIYLTRKKEEQM